MAYRRWVVNASPLILLCKIEQLQLLGALAEQIAVPRAVIREVTAKPDGERTVQTLTALESAIIVDDAVPLANILSWDLGAGETQVIGHAVMRSADGVVIDDLEARRCAKAMGLAIISRLGIQSDNILSLTVPELYQPSPLAVRRWRTHFSERP